MKNMFSWMKSTRSIAVILSFGLIFIIVIGSVLGRNVSSEVLAFTSGIVGGVMTGYFGKRDSTEDRE